ncbi:MAG TPA: TonB family protein [Candidatus Sulfotelmatobacter sp.]|nr:TonB family protein [Candidatus Sulfotelmatobacter sp.]
MSVRCLLFSSDDGIAHSVRTALLDLGFDVDPCTSTVEGVHKVTTQAYQLLIVDWNGTEAEFLLKTARDRRASERPLTLALAKTEAETQTALQAGANSLLRKPFTANQIRDTLTTARDLLNSQVNSSVPPVKQKAVAAAGSLSATAASVPSAPVVAQEGALRAGDFLHSSTSPGSQVLTESDVPRDLGQVSAPDVHLLKDLEPMAASVSSQQENEESPISEEPRGLSWYLKNRPGAAAAPAPAPVAPPASNQPELLSYDQTPSRNIAPAETAESETTGSRSASDKATAQLFAYIERDSSAFQTAGSSSRRWMRIIAIAVALTVVSVVAYAKRQSPWPRTLFTRATQSIHNWLNPQPATTAQAPTTHENFGHAGDEYKLPVAENIPDATTDPSQIQVLPVVDPTAKQPNAAAGNPTQSANDSSASAGNDTVTPDAATSPTVAADSTNPPPPPKKPTIPPSISGANPGIPENSPTSVSQPRDPMRPPAPRTIQVTSGTYTQKIPSSLRSQIAPAQPPPVVNGNKALETALPAIEPVSVPEVTARSLITQQVDPVYPASAKNQTGKVILGVLIARDGTVQDAKFLQGSLAFARPAINAVKQWQFKPYIFNGRPVSIETQLNIEIKPAK